MLTFSFFKTEIQIWSSQFIAGNMFDVFVTLDSVI